MHATASILIDLGLSIYWRKHVSVKLQIIGSDGDLDLLGIITYTADSYKATKYLAN